MINRLQVRTSDAYFLNCNKNNKLLISYIYYYKHFEVVVHTYSSRSANHHEQ
jgi:hypothetical protein